MNLKFFCIIIILCLSFISASFQTGMPSHVIDLEYSYGDFIKGWINISLVDEFDNSFVESSEGSSVSIGDLLNLNNLGIPCAVIDCATSYKMNYSKPVHKINLSQGQSQLVGFRFSEDMDDITDVSFKISSDADKSCYNQIKIDLFNDGTIDILNTNETRDRCTLFRNTGCFNKSKVANEVSLDYSIPICQRIELPESKGFRIGANVSSDNLGGIMMTIHNVENGNFLDSCVNNSVIGKGEFFCDVDYQNFETNEYYICIKNSGEEIIKIKYYPDVNGCGFFGDPPSTENAAYNIIAYSKQFGAFNTFSMPENYDYDFVFDVRDYLTKKYGGFDCEYKNCIVPLRIISRATQEITFSDLKFSYNTDFGPKFNILNEFYNLTESTVNLNTAFQQIFLDEAKFNTPSSYGNKTFSLSLGGETIFSEDIYIREMPVIYSLTPLLSIASIPTKFNLFAVASSSDSNITKYRWTFENNVVETSVNHFNYTFNNVGNFEINMTVFDSNQMNASKTFNITVETPIKAVNLIFNEKFALLNSSKTQLSELSEFYQTSLQPVFNLVQKENKLIQIKDNLDSIGTTANPILYIDIMKDLEELEFPLSIFVSKSSPSPISFYFEESKIDLDSLKVLGGDYTEDKTNEYKEAVLSWMHKNIESELEFDEISANFGDRVDILLTGFELNLNLKEGADNAYIIFSDPSKFNFKENYDGIEKEGYLFIPVEKSKKIIFSVEEELDFSNLPLFISPSIDKLGVLEIELEEDNNFKWIFFGLIIFVVLVLAIVFYIVLQKWYKNKYESYLFPNKNDLYNLVNFIEGAKKGGKSEEQIKESLRKSGWNKEQLTYIMRKYLGKRTGLFKLPGQKFLESNKKQPLPSSPAFPKKITNNSLPRRRFRKI